jgi:cell fate (sporulation/competence/biofilm development) regulator YlbF (YheA/YmcA/DUF963 family)
MNEVMYQTRKLNQEIKNSNEYNHYVRILNKLKEDDKLYKRLMEFERKNIRIQTMSDFNADEDVTWLRDEYSDILSLASVNEFLGAEKRLIRMLNKVEEGILSDLQLAIELLDD